MGTLSHTVFWYNVAKKGGMIMSKKKKNIIIAVTALLFFGALLFNLKYPLMSETYAKQNTVAQNKLATDNKTGGSESKLDKQKAGEQEKDRSAPEVAKTETSETEVKLDANTAAKSGGSSSTSSSNKSNSGSKSSSGSTSSGGSGSSGGGTSSGGTTPAKPSTPAPTPKPPTPAPALKPFSVPASNSFNDVYQSTDSGRAELLIVMDSSENYEAQLNQLYSVIAPVVGSQLANQIVGYARTKTDAYISLDRSWPVSGRTLELGSTWGDWGVSFYSWRK